MKASSKKSIIVILFFFLLIPLRADSSAQVMPVEGPEAEEIPGVDEMAEDERASEIEESISSWQIPETEQLVTLRREYRDYSQKGEIEEKLITIIEDMEEEIEKRKQGFQTYETQLHIEDLRSAKTKLQSLLTSLRITGRSEWPGFIDSMDQTIEKIL